MEMIFPKVHTVAFGFKDAEQKALAVEILKDARGRVQRRQESWVCCAIGDVSDIADIQIFKRRYPQSTERENIGKALKNEIQRRLDGCVFVTGWLRDQGIDEVLVYDEDNARQYRLRWIDSMIEELQ